MGTQVKLLLRPRHVVRLTGIGYPQLYKLVKAGVLPAIKPGGLHMYFKKEDIEKTFQIKL